MSMADPADTRRTFVGGARAAALQVPVDPRATAYVGPAASEPGTGVLEIELEGYPVAIRPTEASVREVVGTAYLLGGFELVQALDAAAREEVSFASRDLKRLKSGMQALHHRAQARPEWKDTHNRMMAAQLAVLTK